MPTYSHAITSTRRRQLLAAAGASLLGCAFPGGAIASAIWRQLDAAVQSVGQSEILDSGLQLTLPLVAEDGSSVPLTVSSNGLQGRRIERLEIFAPNNPTPEVAIFEFGPDVSRVELMTRIRLSESQTVIAVAHTSDGKVIVAERAVRVTVSGCIAPAKSDPASEMKARVRVPQSWTTGDTGEVLTMISHPMITGLAADASGNTPSERIIRSFQASLEGEPVVKAQYFRSLSANPYLKFQFAPSKAGELHFEWTEDTGRKVEVTEKVSLA